MENNEDIENDSKAMVLLMGLRRYVIVIVILSKINVN